MAITYIAFIDCVLETEHWFPRFYAPDYNPTKNNSYTSYVDNARVSLTDIAGTRHYFTFHRNAKVYVINNVFVYESDTGEEIAIDESKQSPKKKRIDE